MMILLEIVIIVLALVIIYLFYSKKKRDKQLLYMKQEIEEIIKKDSIQRIRIVTDDKPILQLASSINTILEYNHKNRVQYTRTKSSMKKMLSNISHDLKTPLTVILGYMEMLQLKGEEQEMVIKSYQKAKEVLELINKFFDLAKLESGDKEIPRSKLNLCEVCRNSILDFYDLLSKTSMEIHIDIPEKGIFIMGNEEAIGRILSNLITNAMKYGSGGKYLGFTVRAEGQYAFIEVIDKGKGIEEQYKEEVFERIFTLEDSRSRDYQGSGLGLTITKHLVEALGGEIHLNSIPYEKTVFSVKLEMLSY